MKHVLMSLLLFVLTLLNILSDSVIIKTLTLCVCLPVGIRDFIRTSNREYRMVLSIILIIGLGLLFHLLFRIF